MRRLVQMVVLAAVPAAAASGALAGASDAVLAARTIRPGDVIAPADVRLGLSQAEGALIAREAAVGMVARRLLVAGQPVMEGDVGPPALVKRNAHVTLVFDRGGLSIRAEGRALSDGAAGDRVRVMNLVSRQTVTGTVTSEGSIEVGERE